MLKEATVSGTLTSPEIKGSFGYGRGVSTITSVSQFIESPNCEKGWRKSARPVEETLSYSSN